MKHMFEMLVNNGAVAAPPKPLLTYSTTTAGIVPGVRNISDTYYAGNGSIGITHGGIGSGPNMNSKAEAFNIAAVTTAQVYNPGSPNAFGCAVYYPPGNFVVYTGAIWENGIGNANSYTHGWWSRTLVGASDWTALSSSWAAVDGYIWKGHAVVYHKSAIWYFGGFNHTAQFTTTNAVWKASGDPLWCSLYGRMPYAAQGVSAVSDGKHIYIYGGTIGGGRLANMYRLDTDTGIYTRMENLPIPTCNSPGVVIKGHIIFLVKDPTSNLAKIIAYDIENSFYHTFDTNITFRSGYGVYQVGNRVYFTGGCHAYWSMALSNATPDVVYGTYLNSIRQTESVIIDMA